MVVDEGAGPGKGGLAMMEITIKGDALVLVFVVLALARALRYR